MKNPRGVETDYVWELTPSQGTRKGNSDMSPARAGDKFLVTMGFGDADEVETSREAIVLTVEIETENDIPYLKEVQREALEKARRELDLQIQAMKTVPHPSA